MPMYDYRCTACGAGFEKLVRGSDPAPACPECGGAADRAMSATSAPGTSGQVIAAARKQAAREGHFSHYSAAERRRVR